MPLVPLPIDAALPKLLAALRGHDSVVLVAPPGAGKTTRVPPAVLPLLSADQPNLVMLQPRRVAARAAAGRIAFEQGWTVGREVGYHVRFDRKIGRDTRIRVLTEGILTRQLLDDPSLDGVGAVLLDEFHERSLNTDLAIALLREVQQSIRPDLKLVVMSATLSAEPVAKFLGDAPIVRSEGRLFPIDLQYNSKPAPPGWEQVPAAVDELRNDPNNKGHILVFLPGMDEIRRAMSAIRGTGGSPLSFADHRRAARATDEWLILPLHGSLTAEEQDAALRPSDRRKIILSTNIAETSLTIDGVTNVIDTGLVRVASYDAERGLDRLDLSRISRASADQRAGRAGRTAPGRCIRLWTEKEHHALAAFDEPEIRRVDLASTVLMLHAWGVNPRTFGWFEAPTSESLDRAEELLEMLGALEPPAKAGGPPIDARGGGPPASAGGALPHLTDIGKQMAQLPMHPRLARLLVEARSLGLSREGAALAALLSEKDILPFVTDRESRRANVIGDSDVLLRLERLEAGDRSLDHVAVKAVNAARHQFLQAITPSPRRGEGGEEGGDAHRRNGLGNRAASAGDRRSAASDERAPKESERFSPHPNPLPSGTRGPDVLLRKLILLAYPDRVCKRRDGDPSQAVMVGGGGVRIGDESIVAKAPFFVAVDARHDPRSRTQQAIVRIASAIESEWLEEWFPQSIRQQQTAEFDAARGRVVGVRRTLYRDLSLRENTNAPVDDEQAAHVLAKLLRSQLDTIAKNDEQLASLLARMELLAQVDPEHFSGLAALAASSQPENAAQLATEAASPQNTSSDWIFQACYGVRTLDDARRKLPQALRDQLIYPLDRLLEQNAPESIQVPTGNHIKIDYKLGQRPVLAVRLQEIFGWLDTPRIASSKIPLLLHLLGPNYRPVQVTDDLRSFWATTYFQVRKDLRVRYPKHAWPEDPLTATPQAKGRPRR